MLIASANAGRLLGITHFGRGKFRAAWQPARLGPAADHDTGAAVQQPSGDGQPNAAGTAGDEGRPASQVVSLLGR